MDRQRLKSMCGWAFAIYWVALFVGTHIPLPELPGPDGSDKAMHFGAYFGLQFLCLLWMSFRRPLSRRDWGLATTMICLYAIADELLQPYVNRHCDVWDCVADWTGAIAALLVFRLLSPKFAEWQAKADKHTPSPNSDD